MSRGAARQQITLAQHREATAHVECRKDSGVLDESPAAYKSIDDVMAAQLDLVEVVHTLRQVLCVKGNERCRPRPALPEQHVGVRSLSAKGI